MTKRKHPQDRAERLKINEEKKARKSKPIQAVLDRSSGTFPSDEKD